MGTHMGIDIGTHIGIPTEILWEWDGNGNGNSPPTATLPGARKKTLYSLSGRMQLIDF